MASVHPRARGRKRQPHSRLLFSRHGSPLFPVRRGEVDGRHTLSADQAAPLVGMTPTRIRYWWLRSIDTEWRVSIDILPEFSGKAVEHA